MSFVALRTENAGELSDFGGFDPFVEVRPRFVPESQNVNNLKQNSAAENKEIIKKNYFTIEIVSLICGAEKRKCRRVGRVVRLRSVLRVNQVSGVRS